MVGILLSFWEGLFSGAMLVLGRVVFKDIQSLLCSYQKHITPNNFIWSTRLKYVHLTITPCGTKRSKHSPCIKLTSWTAEHVPLPQVALPKGSWLIQHFLQWKLKGEVRNPRHVTNDLNTLPEAPPKPTPKDIWRFWRIQRTFFHEQIPPYSTAQPSTDHVCQEPSCECLVRPFSK